MVVDVDDVLIPELYDEVATCPSDDRWDSFAGNWKARVTVASALADAADGSLDPATLLALARRHLEVALKNGPAERRCLVRYRLGTVLSGLARLTWNGSDLRWAEVGDVPVLRRDARLHLSLVGVDSAAPIQMRCMAYTNLGADLFRSARTYEAVNSYVSALTLDSTFGPAAVFLADILLSASSKPGFSASWEYMYSTILLRTARQHSRSLDLAPHAWDLLPRLEELAVSEPTFDDPRLLDGHAMWVHQNRLGFHPGWLGGALPSGDGWIPGVGQLSAGTHNAGIVGMFNDLKSDFLVACELAYQAEADDRSDAAEYLSTSPEERYGREMALYRTALSRAVQLLDSATVTWMHLAGFGSPSHAYFRTAWDDEIGIRSEVVAAMHRHNAWNLVALADLRRDLDRGGYLSHLTSARHAVTHRFLRPITADGVAETEGVDLISADQLRELTLDALRLCRNVVLTTIEGLPPI